MALHITSVFVMIRSVPPLITIKTRLTSFSNSPNIIQILRSKTKTKLEQTPNPTNNSISLILNSHLHKFSVFLCAINKFNQKKNTLTHCDRLDSICQDFMFDTDWKLQIKGKYSGTVLSMKVLEGDEENDKLVMVTP